MPNQLNNEPNGPFDKHLILTSHNYDDATMTCFVSFEMLINLFSASCFPLIKAVTFICLKDFLNYD